ncbi:aldose 1-epimerase family protein [Devosia sp. 2618]|uniref:aldose epimerase family protein n=1 Tax=Devosia sp. 2618 TaxID=3156454 RepID=UPI0033933A4E
MAELTAEECGLVDGVPDMIHLRCSASIAQIARKGAELRALELDGRTIIWTGDLEWWGYTSPILFPIVGRVRDGTIRVDGRQHQLDMHGFTRESHFAVIDQTLSSARLRLTDTSVTRENYPFAFQFDVVFELTESALTIRFQVSAGDTELPYALGYHPAFPWPTGPEQRSAYSVSFETAEAPRVEVFSANGLLTGRQRDVPKLGRSFALADSLFDTGSALCYLRAQSRWLELADWQGHVTRLTTTNFPHLAVWSKPGAPFVSLEAWTGHGDPEGFEGEFAAKPSIMFARPEHANHHTIVLSSRLDLETAARANE